MIKKSQSNQPSIDLFEEGLLPLAAAAKLLPNRRAGKPTHVATLFRWAQVGCKGVKLETLQVGGCRCTTRAALSRFFARLSGNDPAPAARTSSRRDREVARAEAELKAAGI